MSQPPQRNDVTRGTERLEAFSDAVMAVIITLLAFGLKPPERTSYAALTSPKELATFGIYVLSFVLVAIYWNNHHHLLRATTRIGGAVMWANMLLLFWLSLIPVATQWFRATGDQSVPVATFGVVELGAAVAYGLLVRAIVRANGRASLVGVAIASDRKGYASIALYAAGIAVAGVAVAVSWALYGIVAVIWLVPDRRITRAVAAGD
ncbi:MAG: TMEM175 family protein [Actinomycetota bacterium]